MDANDYFRIALDPLRLSLLGRAAEGRIDLPAVSQAFGVSERTVMAAIGKLRAAGLIDEDLSLNRSELRAMASTLPRAEAADPAVVGDVWSAEEMRVLGRFFSGGRLRSIPASAGKRRLVLERLAQEFEPGERYDERLVNEVITVFHDDYAALRRYMVEEGLLTRERGVYWRSGGRFVLGDDPEPVDASTAGPPGDGTVQAASSTRTS